MIAPCALGRLRLRQSLPWVHLRKMEADTPPLEGLPQTMSTTSLFTSDMTSLNVTCQSNSHAGKGQLSGGQLASSFSCGQVQPVALDTGFLSGTTQSDSTGWQQTGG